MISYGEEKKHLGALHAVENATGRYLFSEVTLRLHSSSFLGFIFRIL